MSTVSKDPAPRSRPNRRQPKPEPDPFCYGWRFTRVTRADGTEVVEQVPLTLEDVLHPEVGDTILQTDPHDTDCAYLKAVSKVRLEHDPTAVVLSDCQVDWNLPRIKPLCPDLAIFLGVRRRIGWTSFNVAKERARPALVVEVTSPDTRTNDVVIKVDYYHRAKVPFYVIADVNKESETERKIELISYRRTPTRYTLVKPNPRGWIWLDPLGLWLGVTRDPIGGFNRLACFDSVTGREVGDYGAITKALEAKDQALAAKDQALAAKDQALAEAEARIRELEAAIKRSTRRKS